ncbi:MAG: NAD(+) synthase [Peptococcaceae bacterium]|nr:NAD(+) synthase [Peptococcaceae bacterium]
MFDTYKMGYVRVGAAVPKIEIGNPQANTLSIIDLIERAAALQIKVLVFPELCLTGYTCADLFQQRLLLDRTISGLQLLLDTTRDKKYEMLIIVGMPVEADNQLFNCGIVLHRGKILGVVPKVFIPNYNEFYEKRWFSSATERVKDSIVLCSQEVPFGENLLFRDSVGPLCLGLELCEDLWTPIPPSSLHTLHGANLILNLSASNELVGKMEYRESLVRQQSARCVTAYVYASAGPSESTTDMVFGGHLLVAENGQMLAEKQFQEPELIYADVDIQMLMHERHKTNNLINTRFIDPTYRTIFFNLNSTFSAQHPIRLQRSIKPYPFVPDKKEDRDKRCREIFTIQTMGLVQRLKKIGVQKVIIGISGGLDSTLALLVCREAFAVLKYPFSQVLGITMPGFGTTNRTKKNAQALMKELGIQSREISIVDACTQHFKDIGHDPQIHDITYENVQARERTQILMDLANKENALVVGTGDLSELALGWCTYNGDHMSHYAVNAGVPKTLVKYLISWYADTTENSRVAEILKDILNTPISPELLPPDHTDKIEQKTEDIIGSYDLHDFFLYYMLRWGFSPLKIYYLACQAFEEKFSDQEILKWLKVFYRRFFSQQFKRSCLPDGPKVGTICLSPRGDWRMPSDASAAIWLQELEKLQSL